MHASKASRFVPGVSRESANESANGSSPSQRRGSTISRRRVAIVALPPP